MNKEAFLKNVPDTCVEDIKRIFDAIETVRKTKIATLSDFMDPYRTKLSISLINSFKDINYSLLGGSKNSERKAILIYYKDEDYKPEDYIGVLKSELKDKINHRDILGAIMNLGIKREKVGDIIISDAFYIIAKKELLSFIELNLNKISKYKIKFSPIAIEEVVDREDEFISKIINISSPRLDNIIAEVYNISRSLSKKICESENVKVEYKYIDKASYEVSEKSMISVRGYGRFIFDELINKSKKGRYNYRVYMYK